MLFYAPWNPSVRLPAEVIETRTAHCKFMGLPPTATAAQYHQRRGLLAPAQVAAMQAAGRVAAAQWQAMQEFRPVGANDGQPVLAAMESGQYEYLFVLGGRAGGKSHEVADSIIDLCSRKRKRVVCGREFQSSLVESCRALLVEKIKKHPSANEWTILDTELKHSNGTLITFIGLARNIQSVKSLEGCDIFWGEEAQSISSASLEILIPTIREHGSMLVFTLNPRFVDDPVYRLACVEVPEAAFVKVVEFEDNPFLFTSRLMNDLRHSFKTSKRFKHVWRGDLDRNSELLIIQHSVGRPPVMPGYEMSGKRMYGIDFGGTDPTAFVRLTYYAPEALGRDKDDKGALHFDGEFVAPCRSNRDIVEGVSAACPEVLTGEWMVKADSADPKAIGELNNAGIPTYGAVKGNGSVLAGLRKLADFDVWISPECKVTIKCAENYRWKADATGLPTNVPEHEYSHPFDAARYAIEGEDLSGSAGVDYLVITGEWENVQGH